MHHLRWAREQVAVVVAHTEQCRIEDCQALAEDNMRFGCDKEKIQEPGGARAKEGSCIEQKWGHLNILQNIRSDRIFCIYVDSSQHRATAAPVGPYQAGGRVDRRPADG